MLRQFVLASTKSVAKFCFCTSASATERSICRNDEAGVCEGDAGTGSIHSTACAIRSVSLHFESHYSRQVCAVFRGRLCCVLQAVCCPSATFVIRLGYIVSLPFHSEEKSSSSNMWTSFPPSIIRGGNNLRTLFNATGIQCPTRFL